MTVWSAGTRMTQPWLCATATRPSGVSRNVNGGDGAGAPPLSAPTADAGGGGVQLQEPLGVDGSRRVGQQIGRVAEGAGPPPQLTCAGQREQRHLDRPPALRRGLGQHVEGRFSHPAGVAPADLDRAAALHDAQRAAALGAVAADRRRTPQSGVAQPQPGGRLPQRVQRQRELAVGAVGVAEPVQQQPSDGLGLTVRVRVDRDRERRAGQPMPSPQHVEHGRRDRRQGHVDQRGSTHRPASGASTGRPVSGSAAVSSASSSGPSPPGGMRSGHRWSGSALMGTPLLMGTPFTGIPRSVAPEPPLKCVSS